MFVRTTRLAFSQLLRIHKQQRAMTTQSTKFKLNTGAEIPAIGFGTWQDAEAQEAAVLAALKAGYRHIDTARMLAHTTYACPN
jgi:hypothetical protein